MNPPKVLCVRTVEDSLLGSDIQPYCFSFLLLLFIFLIFRMYIFVSLFYSFL